MEATNLLVTSLIVLGVLFLLFGEPWR